MRIRFWCNHCGEFDKSVTIELDEIGAYTISPKFCPKCMFVLKHADVEDVAEVGPSIEPKEDTGIVEEIPSTPPVRPTIPKIK